MKYIEKTLNNTITVTGIINLHFFEFPKDFYTQKESHPFYELIYVESGVLHIKSEDYTGLLEKGQIILHKPNENHSLLCDEDSSPTVIIIGFNCDNSFIDRFTSCPTTLTMVEIKNLAEIIKEGRNVFAPPYNIPTYDMKKKNDCLIGSEQILKILLEYFFIRLIRRFSNCEISDNENSHNEKLAVNEIINYLEQNFTEKISIDELAFLFNTNRSTLCHEFKSFTKKTINEYINDIKISKSKSLLMTTNKSITVISRELGFESIHYFTRFFKRSFHLTPSEFRKRK